MIIRIPVNMNKGRNILILKDNDMDIIKKNFLCSKIFDGKSF